MERETERKKNGFYMWDVFERRLLCARMNLLEKDKVALKNTKKLGRDYCFTPFSYRFHRGHER